MQTFFSCHYSLSNYLHSIYTVLGIINNLGLKYIRDVCKLYANTMPFLYKGLEHPRILVFVGGPGANLLRMPRDSGICLPACLFILITQSCNSRTGPRERQLYKSQRTYLTFSLLNQQTVTSSPSPMFLISNCFKGSSTNEIMFTVWW